jgi:hypothetical protein
VLDLHSLPYYLLERELITRRQVVDGDLQIREVPGRNRNYRVTCSETAYLIKQQDETGSGDLAAGAQREALIYRILGSSRMRSYLPRYHLYDASRRVLVVQLIESSLDMKEYHLLIRRFPIWPARALGRALGKLHTLEKTGARTEHIDLGSWPPGTLSVQWPDRALYEESSYANHQLIGAIQRFADFWSSLDILSHTWYAGTVIHGDIKWSNCLVSMEPGTPPSARLKIVDWEAARMGDPCWDVGSVFNDYLSFWLQSIPVTGEDTADRMLELALYPLDRMQPAMRAFWYTYARETKLSGAEAEEWLLRSVRYAAARLVQTAFEQMQDAPHLTGNAVCMLQVSLNMLKRPTDASQYLLGIPAASVGAA